MSNSNTSSNTSAFPAEKKWKSAILEIFFMESTSEFQMSVTVLLVNKNINCGQSFS